MAAKKAARKATRRRPTYVARARRPAMKRPPMPTFAPQQGYDWKFDSASRAWLQVLHVPTAVELAAQLAQAQRELVKTRRQVAARTPKANKTNTSVGWANVKKFVKDVVGLK